jgi:hypothetical protein
MKEIALLSCSVDPGFMTDVPPHQGHQFPAYRKPKARPSRSDITGTIQAGEWTKQSLPRSFLNRRPWILHMQANRYRGVVARFRGQGHDASPRIFNRVRNKIQQYLP